MVNGFVVLKHSTLSGSPPYKSGYQFIRLLLVIRVQIESITIPFVLTILLVLLAPRRGISMFSRKLSRVRGYAFGLQVSPPAPILIPSWK